MAVCGGGKEVGEVGGEDYLAEDGGGVVEAGVGVAVAVAIGAGVTAIGNVAGAEFLGYLLVRLLEVVFEEGGVDAAAVVELGAVV